MKKNIILIIESVAGGIDKSESVENRLPFTLE
jgi:hypothetical protein